MLVSKVSTMLHSSLHLPVEKQPLLYRLIASILSVIYSLIVKVRNALYDRGILKSTRLPGICVSVGNITVGGTGKSPLVMEIANRLIEDSMHPVIVTRGYKSSLARNEYLVLLGGNVHKKNFTRELKQIPDEAMMYSQRLPKVPILVGSRRVCAAQWYLETESQTTHWILDDGFQHRSLNRDWDIVLMDAQNPFGNGKILPLGTLREGLRSLKRANFLCFTRAHENTPNEETLQSIKSYTSAPFEKIYFDFDLESLEHSSPFSKENEPALLVCGIAQPEHFISQIKEKGIQIGDVYSVGDHHSFDKEKIQHLLNNSQSIISTEKDYWRNPSLFHEMAKPCFLAKLRIFSRNSGSLRVLDALSSLQKRK